MEGGIFGCLVGRDRFSINGYYLYRQEDSLESVVKKNPNAYPVAGTKVLFCSHVGGTEMANILEYDKVKKHVTIHFAGQTLRFAVEFSQIILKWELVNKLPAEIIEYYQEKDIYVMQNSIEEVNNALNNFERAKTKHFSKIENITEISKIQKQCEELKKKIETMLSNNMFNIDKVVNNQVIEENGLDQNEIDNLL